LTGHYDTFTHVYFLEKGKDRRRKIKWWEIITKYPDLFKEYHNSDINNPN